MIKRLRKKEKCGLAIKLRSCNSYTLLPVKFIRMINARSRSSDVNWILYQTQSLSVGDKTSDSRNSPSFRETERELRLVYKEKRQL